MAGMSSFFFNNFQSSQEQRLLEDLIVESISIYGQDMYYIPRTIANKDSLYTEDDSSRYENAILVCMYIKSIDGFSGDGNFMSKFGLEIRDQVVFSVAQRTFNEEIQTVTSQIRPNEGDLIYFPLNRKCFQIKFTNKFEMFYQLGALQTYELTCELFEYSSEVFNTGIPEIDIMQTKFSENVLDWTILDEDGNYLMTEDDDYLVVETFEGASSQADIDITNQVQTESDGFVDFTERDPFSELGVF